MEKEMKNLKLAVLLLTAFLLLAVVGCDAKKTADLENGLEFEQVNTFEKVLKENPNGVLANRNGDNMRTQIMTFQFIDGNKVYFGTNVEKPLYKQLVENPYVSYCTFPSDFKPVLSLNGKVVFTEDREIKARALEGEYLSKYYKSPDDPNLKVFYIDVDEIETYGNDGVKIYRAK